MAGIAAITLPAAHATPHIPAGPAATGTLEPPPPTDRLAAEPLAGISLPGGGWIPYRTAAVIAGLSALTWIKVRRHYRPDPNQPRDHTHDPDLQPPNPAILTILTALDQHGQYGQQEPMPAEELPPGILHLSGPGAADAARGLIVTTALTTTARVYLSPADMVTLLSGSNPDDAAACPPISADGQVPADHHRGQSEGHNGYPGPTTVVLDDSPAVNHHWQISVDGYATGTGLTTPRRLCVLTATAATDLLQLAGLQPAPQVASSSGQAPSLAPANQTDTVTTATVNAHLNVFGACQLTVDGQPVIMTRTAGLQTLVYLALHSDGATRQDLSRAIWPHQPPATVSQRFHSALSDLRKQLRPLLDDDPVIRRDDRYRLNTAAISTDLQTWHTAVHAVTHAVGTSEQQAVCLALIDSYPADVAAGETWPWLRPVREQIRRTIIDAYATLAYHAEPPEALAWLRQAISFDPHNEPLHQQAADLLRAGGDENGAADLMKRLHQRLNQPGASAAVRGK